MTEASVFIQKRGRVKGTLTRLKTFVENISDSTTIESINIRLEKIEEIWNEFKVIEDNLLLFPNQVSEREEFEAKYFDIKDTLMLTRNSKISNQGLINSTLYETPTVNHSTISNDQFSSAINSILTSQQVFFETFSNSFQSSGTSKDDCHLPKLHIPSFSGNFKEWQSFSNIFETSIHNNQKLSSCKKLQYLKGLLQGEAAAIIRHLDITENNYAEAWEKLKLRYNKKRQITTSIIKTFTDTHTVVQPSAKPLRSLCDTFDEVVRALRALGEDAQKRDPWLIHIALNKLDSESKQLWSNETTDIDFPTFELFLEFLNKRCDGLELSTDPLKKTHITKTFHTSSSPNIKSRLNCSLCTGDHLLCQCPQFRAQSLQHRKTYVLHNAVCFNCLRSGHSARSCLSKNRCIHCKGLHHTLLHGTQPDQPSTSGLNDPLKPPTINTSHNSPINTNTSTTTNSQELSSLNTSIQNNHLQSTYSTESICLLPTALANVKDCLGNTQSCRVLLDSGSQVSFVSEALVHRLGVKRTNARLAITGIAATKTGYTKGKVRLKITSQLSESKTVDFDGYIINKLTSLLPSSDFNVTNWKHLKNYQLADPQFNKPSSIDILLGADKFFEILENGQIQVDKNLPMLQNTIFGWVIAGTYSKSSNSAISSHMSVLSDIDSTLKRFWEQEDVDQRETLSTDEEKLCEEHFQQNTVRDEKGRFVVSLPFKPYAPTLGHSLPIAIKRFYSVERRLQKDPSLKEQYTKFMQEYASLGHMELVPASEINEDKHHQHFYLPHHAVFKNSPMPKIRVVFDGSAKTTAGHALNEILMVGAVVQRDLFSILINFRKHQVALSADIEKMYRQIRVANKDKEFQRIVWREHASKPLQHYRLSTVTYGTSSAPFLATRTLLQIAKNIQSSCPDIAEKIKNDFYVDDLLSGADTYAEAVLLKKNLTEILAKNGFNLTKWKSNYTNLADGISTHSGDSFYHIDDNQNIAKVLGLAWNSYDDTFGFHISTTFNNEPSTKRRLLSESSRIFDPLGLLSPVTITIKILFQQLWLSKLAWDDPLPPKLAERWNQIKINLPKLSKIKIPRHIRLFSDNIQLHGFADASELAFSAVVYCRTQGNNHTSIRLVAAKTKVAPLQQVSLPRLELCGALLLTKLIVKVCNALAIQDIEVWAWTDSSIVLSWLSDTPRRWKSYVGNRTSEILKHIPRNRWRHVPSPINPADQASRGISPQDLLKSELWWNGPPWLLDNVSSWPKNIEHLNNTHLEERNKPVILNQQNISDCLLSKIVSRCSSWTKILRIVSYCTRFLKNCRLGRESREMGLIKGHELKVAEILIIKWVQSQAFNEEIKCLSRNIQIRPKSRLSSLFPFLDSNQILRVSGRLQHSTLDYNTKHPVILPSDHEIGRLIVREMHLQYLHPGIALLMNIIRQKYWIIRLRNIVKQVTHNCISCVRQRARTTHQLMGNLPSHRVTPSRPFLRSGVDFAGPINMYPRISRGCKSFKGYIALFVCFATKAIHLDIVTSLSTEAFLASLRRFVSRRGIPTDMYSDNGTNFVGASRRLIHAYNEAFNMFIKDPLINDFILQNNITWHFIPPGAPHFGGIWEAGVKAVKAHITRVIGDKTHSYEEMLTLLTQIEAILNSRPLCQLSEDPESLEVLTPAHFLIGDLLTSIPEPILQEQNITRLGRWHQIQAMTQGFWRRWKRDYLTSLQQRPKWNRLQPSVMKDDMVILSEENLPPTKWAIGRVIDVHPGPDGIIRVVTIKTAKGTYQRPINKVIPLPKN